MMNWYRRGNPKFAVPAPIRAEDWKPVLLDSEQIYELDELAALFNACMEAPNPVQKSQVPTDPTSWGAIPKAVRVLLPQLAPKFTCQDLNSLLQRHGFELTPKCLQKAITDAAMRGHIERLGRHLSVPAAYAVTELGLHTDQEDRYTREHWRRFLVCEIGTAAREAALRELKWDQVDLIRNRVRLNPEGRRQTKKRRPTLAIAPTFGAELASWRRDSEFVIAYYGRGLKTREFYKQLAETAGVGGSAKVIRHTVRTYLAERGVPDSEADQFMGHREEGSPTGRRYKHRRPEFLRSVVEAIEELYGEINELLKHPFKGREKEDQPMPDADVCMQVRAK